MMNKWAISNLEKMKLISRTWRSTEIEFDFMQWITEIEIPWLNMSMFKNDEFKLFHKLWGTIVVVLINVFSW